MYAEQNTFKQRHKKHLNEYKNRHIKCNLVNTAYKVPVLKTLKTYTMIGNIWKYHEHIGKC